MTRPAPYPADTRAKGWRFELDYERIEQSDTWALAAEVPMAQHALLMMWLVAWKETPCGSLPADESLIRSKLRIPPKTWAAMRNVLMRGWTTAEDGRLYHATVSARVLEMLDYRAKAAKRVADHKLRMREQRSANALPTCEQRDSNDTGTGTGSKEEIQDPPPPSVAAPPPKTRTPKPAPAPKPSPGRPDDVSEQVWTDWVALRTKKRATVSPTVIAEARKEAGKADMPLEAFLTVWCLRGSQGLEASWLKPAERMAHVIPINRQEAQEQRNRAVGDQWLSQQEDYLAEQR